ncbi:MAG TPA: hypothetical protein VMU39_09680 [Solirubrobacteraceae bacterium]|nr:hypothetical protein [Solirubrobacteraceae bacterium]
MRALLATTGRPGGPGRQAPDRRLEAWLAAAVVALSVLTLCAALARADGDPASDVLLRASVFYPYSDPVSPSLQKTLDAETEAADRAHFPIKVALIQSSADLGAVPSMFGRPQTYADFLEQEIDFQARQPLLVVMPEGYGVQGLSAPAAAVLASLVRPNGSQTDDLARAAIAAVGALAARSGHRIDTSTNASAVANSHQSVTLELVALAIVAIAAAAALTARRTTGWPGSGGRVHAGAGAMRRSSNAAATVAHGEQATAIQPLFVVALVLTVAGVVWAAVRGLTFYGVGPVEVGYDLDQPPLLLVIVGAWLWYRSRRR